MNSDPLSRAGDSLPEDESSWNDVFRQALDATREGLSLESVELLQHSDPNFDHEAGFDSFMTVRHKTPFFANWNAIFMFPCLRLPPLST